MSSPLEIAVVVSTYQRPGHLRRCLASLAAQQGVADKFEAIVVDDGSQDETAELVARFRRDAPFPLKFCTHPHDGFQLARCRNSGIRASVAPYLLFTDGDCIFPPGHVRRHLDARQPGVARAGDCIRLDEATSARIDEEAVRSGAYLDWVERKSVRAIHRTHCKSLAYQAVGHVNRPKLTGWNMAIWRDDLQRLNGFDEQFRGWGCEDDDLRNRLRAAGVKIRSALGYTHAFHLWHATHATAPQRWQDGPNVPYLQRPVVLTRCLEGIRRRSLGQISVRVVASAESPQLSNELQNIFRESQSGPELELLVCPNGRSAFTTKDAGRVLIAPEQSPVPARLARSAHAAIRVAPQDGAATVVQALQRLLIRDAASGDAASALRAAA